MTTVPSAASDTPKLIWSVPAGTAGVAAVASVQVPVAGRALMSVQYVQPAAEWRNAVSETPVVDL